jgi:hypothetical protein
MLPLDAAAAADGGLPRPLRPAAEAGGCTDLQAQVKHATTHTYIRWSAASVQPLRCSCCWRPAAALAAGTRSRRVHRPAGTGQTCDDADIHEVEYCVMQPLRCSCCWRPAAAPAAGSSGRRVHETAGAGQTCSDTGVHQHFRYY